MDASAVAGRCRFGLIALAIAAISFTILAKFGRCSGISHLRPTKHSTRPAEAAELGLCSRCREAGMPSGLWVPTRSQGGIDSNAELPICRRLIPWRVTPNPNPHNCEFPILAEPALTRFFSGSEMGA